jgi:hypothetical protein
MLLDLFVYFFTTCIVVSIGGEREAVCDFQGSLIIQTEKLTSNITWIRLATVLNDLQDDLECTNE